MTGGAATGDELAWTDARLAGLGRARTGPATVASAQAWGRVLRVPATGGPVWLKVPAAPLRFELAVLQALGTLEPRLGPTVLAADTASGRILLADAGRTLTDAYAEADLPARFAAALVDLGRVQRSSAAAVPDLLAAGVADLRPTRVPARFDALVADLDPGPELTEGVRPALVDLCAGLAASRVPAGIDHNDLHDGNVLQADDGRVTVVDWGDSVVTHPFAVLLVAQRVLASLLGDVAPDHPAIVDARRDYLAVFADLAPGEDLEATARRAVTVAHVARAWVWQRALSTAGPTGVPDRFADAPRAWFELAVAAIRREAAG